MIGLNFGAGKSIQVRFGAVLSAVGLLGCLALSLPGSAAAALTAEQEVKVAADLAANKSYTDIMASAVAAGVSVEDIVAFLVKAKGAATGAVNEIISAAIAAGYDGDKVVTGALRGGADLKTVLNAAHISGVNRDTCCTGALGAGFTQSQISDAYSDLAITGEGGPKDAAGGVPSPSSPKK